MGRVPLNQPLGLNNDTKRGRAEEGVKHSEGERFQGTKNDSTVGKLKGAKKP